MFTPKGWCACSFPCRILWGAPKLMELEIFSWPGVPCKQKLQLCSINKPNYHKPWDCRHVEIPVILTSACFSPFLVHLRQRNLRAIQWQQANRWLGTHLCKSMCYAAWPLDLWNCSPETKQSQVQMIFGLKTVICNQFALGCVRFPFNVSCCAYIWMLEPSTIYIL